jgi:outer membrane protein
MLYTKETLKKSILALSVAGSLLATQSAVAYESGDFIIKAGAAKVATSSSSSNISVDTPALGDSGVGGVKVDDDTQLGLTFTYMLDNEFGVELLAASPFEHDINLPILPSVNSALGEKIASTKHLPPTVTLNYYMNDASSKFQPYIGLGLNYTIFFEEKVTSNLANPAVIDVLAGGGAISGISSTDIELEDSFGVALHAGFDYALTDEIGISFSYYKLDIDTEAKVTTTSTAGAYTGPVVATVDVDIDPSVLMLGLNYKF